MFKWWVLLMVATSILNCFSLCSIPSSCFTATTALLDKTPLPLILWLQAFP
ncbi:hypothetical protein E1A91_A09G126500v1 [Gossypium mustelinum]|uniref:Uncharacterized protein n=1 Tax=Gossypium mustelinum TaxID=34275 RepID=A0A5D2XXB8_GOSMU|nr:hypothetical protein E1A91_A09G126500v1 [Gossypium mustelinum]